MPSTLHRIIGYQEPPYLVDFDQSPSVLSPNITQQELPVTTITPTKPIEEALLVGEPAQEEGPGWKVFHATDSQG